MAVQAEIYRRTIPGISWESRAGTVQAFFLTFSVNSVFVCLLFPPRKTWDTHPFPGQSAEVVQAVFQGVPFMGVQVLR